jgi:hypothetical protein
MSDPIGYNGSLSSLTPYISPDRLAEIQQRKVEREDRKESAALVPVSEMTPKQVNELNGYYNKALDSIDQIRNPSLPSLEKLMKAKENRRDEGDEGDLDAASAENAAQMANSTKAKESDEAEKAKKAEKKELDITIETYFSPLVKAGDVVTAGRDIAHFEVVVRGKDSDKVDPEEVKQKAMRLVEKNSGKSMGIPGDGNLKADNTMKINFIAGNGKLEGGQRVLSVQGLDGKKPFESYMQEEGGDELERARQYLDDNPDAPDTDEVKKKIAELEKQRASGISDFSLEDNREDRNKDEKKKSQPVR